METVQEIAGFCTPDEIVLEVLNDIGDAADMGQFRRYEQWLYRGYGQLRQFALPVGKEKRIKIDPKTSCIVLPDEFVEFGDIGIYIGGQWWSFTEKPELISITEQECGEEVVSDHDHRLHEIRSGKYATSGGKNPYYYKKDLRNHRIIVYATNLTHCILKYVSTGIKVDGSTLIPIIAKEALIAWLHYQRTLNDKSADKYEAVKREAIWASRLKELRTPRNLTALYDTLYSTIKNTMKR